jgi:hypothetical protein
MDDFTTQGYSGECARQLLLQAGAGEVVCINVSKYGRDYWAISLGLDDYTWDPWSATAHSARSFREVRRGRADKLERVDHDPGIVFAGECVVREVVRDIIW